MRTINRSKRFNKDHDRERRVNIAELWTPTLYPLRLIAFDVPLPIGMRDHSMTGEWKDRGGCHVKPDLVLIYRLPDKDTLELVRLGSHSEMGI